MAEKQIGHGTILYSGIMESRETKFCVCGSQREPEY